MGLNDLNVNVYSDAEYGAGAGGEIVVVGTGVETVVGFAVGAGAAIGAEVGSVVVDVGTATDADGGTVGCAGTEGSTVCGGVATVGVAGGTVWVVNGVTVDDVIEAPVEA